MKRNIILTAISAALMLVASCQKTPVNQQKGNGYLSFGEFTLGLDEELITKASPASGNYTIFIKNIDGDVIMQKSYSEVKNNGNKLSIPAGDYTLVARSVEAEVQIAAFEQPVYGVSKPFSIVAGMTTSIGELTCTLLQCKVTVSYSDEFLASVTGPGSTKVELTAGHPLEFALDADGTYDQSAGYFAVNGNTMTVSFKGSIDGKNMTMNKTFAGIEPKQWRQIRFVPKKNEQGNATFDVEINDLISDAILNNGVDVEEEIIGEDPEAPKGDGGIAIAFDYQNGCDAELTDLQNIKIVPVSERDMSIKLKATIPGGIRKFTVDIESDGTTFNNALAAVDAFHIDLINPAAAHDIIFKVVPFPHGPELVGQTEVEFDLSNAQDEIISHKGTHKFMMTVVDLQGCKNVIPVTMVVE